VSKNTTENSTANSGNSRNVAFADHNLENDPQTKSIIDLQTFRSKLASMSFPEKKKKDKILQIQQQMDSK